MIIDEAAMLDLIFEIDQDFYNTFQSDLVDREQWSSLLHHMWNPQERRYDDDVIIQGKESAVIRRILHLKEEMDLILPPHSTISITLKPKTEKRMGRSQFMFYLNKSSQKYQSENQILYFYEMIQDLHNLELF